MLLLFVTTLIVRIGWGPGRKYGAVIGIIVLCVLSRETGKFPSMAWKEGLNRFSDNLRIWKPILRLKGRLLITLGLSLSGPQLCNL